MGSGINAAATVSLAKSTNIPIIASGGSKKLDDVRTLSVHEQDGVCGVIAGRALYEGSLGLSDAQELSDELSGFNGFGKANYSLSGCEYGARCQRVNFINLQDAGDPVEIAKNTMRKELTNYAF